MTDHPSTNDHLIRISQQLGELTAEIRAANANFAAHSNTDAQFHQVIGERVAALETTVNRTKWLAAGGAGVIVGAIHLVSSWWMGHH